MFQHRSKTGNHVLLPSDSERLFIAQIPGSQRPNAISSWTFGSGTVFWKIWPAILLHTLVAVVVVSISLLDTGVSLGIPNVMMTVLGVVIGFVLAYRVSTGYDRYWLGRCYWSDTVRNSRTLARLIWLHVPLITSTKPSTEEEESEEEQKHRVTREKMMALDLIEGFAVALKHHLRGEMGIYYDDLYHLIRPLHESKRHVSAHHVNATQVTSPSDLKAATATLDVLPPPSPSAKLIMPPADPAIPDINAYGTFQGPVLPNRTNGSRSLNRRPSAHSHASTQGSDTSHVTQTPLLPSSPQAGRRKKWGREISTDLVPFAAVFTNVIAWFSSENTDKRQLHWHQHKPTTSLKHTTSAQLAAEIGSGSIPLETLRCLSEWFAVLEARGTVPGTSMGPIVASIQMFEDALSGLERILTTPLPWVYSVHIRHTIWIYLFFLPFQLIDSFGWYTIPGVGLAAFFYLGFLAAGNEIEQPFGYDENDLDLETFVEVIKADLASLKCTPMCGTDKQYGSLARSASSKANVRRREREALEGVFGEVFG